MPELTKFGDISPRQAAYSAVKMLERGQNLVILERFGQSVPIPKRNTQTIKFRRYESLALATAPLAEGVTPSGQKLTYTDVTAVLQQLGDTVGLTDIVVDTHEDAVPKETIKLCGEQIADTVEVVRYNKLKAGSTVFYANSAASRAYVSSPPLAKDLKRIIRYLNRQKAKPISTMVKASALISTEPVNPSFFAVCHTDLKPDLKNMDGFTEVKNYSNSDKALPGEVGACEEIRFICTRLFDPWLAAGSSATGTTYLSNGEAVSSAAAPDVYPILIFAEDAYAIVPLQGENAVTPTLINPGTPTKDDPLGQRGSVSWKTMQTCCILNQSWCIRYETACTSNPS
jgi:N4-gp56 family major capsid protein